MEELLQHVVNVLVVIVEACGAAVIIIGAVWAFLLFVWVGLRDRSTRAFVPVRLTLGRFLALGLEFQLAADVLKTAVAPSWEEIGQLAAIAAIRTALNYFLGKEIAEEKRQIAEDEDEDDDEDDDGDDDEGDDDSSTDPTDHRRAGRTV
ncbi:DUF1622 domain-containing protein [Blastococcus xanthinilyticus]|uniref:DUF1622 domain-containing protein n=1 Tax=Blastococcus xanthinilyticus TaxID=1564164 RepID=UPI001412BFA7|nr:DUF1622 domain-containing protein [Blastococcus xanthinilyticus]